ncbi:MAG: hypothetical protein KTR14_01360 [Vampirovibrio sp.]|nr:hypothetical protein [Vampirovibrio sp.]
MDMANLTQPALMFLLEAGHDAHGGGEGFDLASYLIESNIFNIAIVVFLFGWLFSKVQAANPKHIFEERRQKVVKELEAVEAKKKEAQAQLDEIKSRTANLSQEVDGILSNAKTSSEALSAKTLENAQLEAAKIVENAKKRVEAEQRAAAKHLEQRLLKESLDEARGELAGKLSQDDQRRSVEVFLEELASQKS